MACCICPALPCPALQSASAPQYGQRANYHFSSHHSSWLVRPVRQFFSNMPAGVSLRLKWRGCFEVLFNSDCCILPMEYFPPLRPVFHTRCHPGDFVSVRHAWFANIFSRRYQLRQRGQSLFPRWPERWHACF